MGTHSRWRQNFTDPRYPPMTKDYRLCRGENEYDIYIDEGGGTRLVCRWAGAELLSYFSVQNQILFTTQHVRADGIMIEEILTATKPGDPSTSGVVSFNPGTIQRFGFRRTGVCNEPTCKLTPAGQTSNHKLNGAQSGH